MMPPLPPQYGFYNNTYGYQSGIFLPPPFPPMPNQPNPFYNNYMGNTSTSQSPDKTQKGTEDNQWDKFRSSVEDSAKHSDINERDSKFGDKFEADLKETTKQIDKVKFEFRGDAPFIYKANKVVV